MENNLPKKRIFIQENQKMSTHFAWMTTALIAIVSIMISVSVLKFFDEVLVDIGNKEKETELYVSSKIFDCIKDNFNEKNVYSVKTCLISPLQEGVIAYVTIKNKDTDQVLFELKGRNKYINNDSYNQYAPQFVFNKNVVIIGFYDRSPSRDYVSDFLSKLSVLIVSSIFIGLVISYLMFKVVSKPIEALTAAATEYKKGNFSRHIKKTHYEEINALIDTYNSMGESLKELYTSLEMKVEKRTVELEKAYKELQETQSMMVHSEKMRSLGELVAGITHEINNPVNFIYGNLIHLKNYSENLINFIEELLKILDNSDYEIIDNVRKLRDKYDYSFIHDDLPELIRSCQDGAERTKDIIMNLKNFSRMGEMTTSSVDIAKEIDVTLNILHNKLKNRITVVKDYAPDIPKIDALGGQLNQVFMNILDNATYAIKEEGIIKISMQHDKNYVTIKIEDNGCGMDKDTLNRLFDPFFTTKPVGQGTGLGMSIAYKIIKNHGGEIFAESEIDKGSVFTIKLPIVNSKIIKGAQ